MLAPAECQRKNHGLDVHEVLALGRPEPSACDFGCAVQSDCVAGYNVGDVSRKRNLNRSAKCT